MHLATALDTRYPGTRDALAVLPELADASRLLLAFGVSANDLIPTGGSDFHGAPKPTVRLGVTHTGRAVPDGVLAELKACRS